MHPYIISPLIPGGTVGYPAHPRLIRLSVRPSVRDITFKFSAENCLGPTDLGYVRVIGMVADDFNIRTIIASDVWPVSSGNKIT